MQKLRGILGRPPRRPRQLDGDHGAASAGRRGAQGKGDSRVELRHHPRQGLLGQERLRPLAQGKTEQDRILLLEQTARLPYWRSRYFPPNVVSRLDSLSKEILDYCGNPDDDGAWSRREWSWGTFSPERRRTTPLSSARLRMLATRLLSCWLDSRIRCAPRPSNAWTRLSSLQACDTLPSSRSRPTLCLITVRCVLILGVPFWSIPLRLCWTTTRVPRLSCRRRSVRSHRNCCSPCRCGCATFVRLLVLAYSPAAAGSGLPAAVSGPVPDRGWFFGSFA